LDIYQYDEALRRDSSYMIAGIDEAGRGPLAGPVVAAAVILKTGIRIDRLRDSKKVPEPERKILYGKILCSALDIGVGIVGPEDIDRLNILNATKHAMRIAVMKLSHSPDLLIIDAVSLAAIELPQISPIKGDSKSASVAAASIIAKCVRDGIMLEYHRQFPEYNFGNHKGYPTAEHINLLQLHGPCPIHRRSFNRVKTLGLPF
jgi:ribonuclease HII